MSENYSSISEITGIVGLIFDNDEFILETPQGNIKVDADLQDSFALDLTLGETVTVRGVYDDEDFDAMAITRQDGSPVLTRPFLDEEDWEDDEIEDFDRTFDDNTNSSYVGSVSEIVGRVSGIFDNDEFILETPQGNIKVDADLQDSLALDLTAGETVIVTGIYDDEDFDAMAITRQDGSPVLTTDLLNNYSYDNYRNDSDYNYDDSSNDLDDNYDDSDNYLDDNYDDFSHDLDDSYDDSGDDLDDSYDNSSNDLDDSYDNSSNDLDDSYDDSGNYLDDNRVEGIPDFDNINTETENSNDNQDSLFNTAVYRFQNRDIKGTFLFAGETESHSIRNNYGEIFEEEGKAFRVADTPADNLEAIYRMANKDIPGTYLYVGEEEKQSISENYTNFENEGIAFYVLGANANQGEDVYRFQSVNNPGTYLFVLEPEKNNIVANYSSQFTLEGVAFEVG